jgi:hypothetical protein
MKKLFLAFMLLSVTCTFAADFPRNTDAVLDYLYAKLGNNVARTAISTDNIDYKICNLQYQACKDERTILRLLTRHIAVADQLMKSKTNNDGKRGLLIANSAQQCAVLLLKDNILAAGIAVGMIQPNINLADEDFNSSKGRINIANEILDAVKTIDDDNAIISVYNMILKLTGKHPNTADAYKIKYAYYQYQHSRYKEALAIMDTLVEPNMITGSQQLRKDIEDKLNKAVN